jgi:hypothetical protein
MTKSVPKKPAAGKRTSRSTGSSRPVRKQQKPRKKAKIQPVSQLFSGNRRHLLLGMEVFGLIIAGLAVVMVVLGYSASWFSGTRFFASLLPFAVFVLGLVVIAAVVLIGWWQVRKKLQDKSLLLPSSLSVSIALVMTCFMLFGQFGQGFEHFRALVGGRQEDRKVTISHQVYAAYRRYDQKQLQKMIERSKQYDAVIMEAAKVYGLDPDLLRGLAAAESSFMPRESKDGGKGLFQISQVPETILAQVGKRLSVDKVQLTDPRHNTLVAAATLKYYLKQMKNNLFLGLLAYNIGPVNGGLRVIMQQYGATDFITIQPYLQQLPRDYPIRVLSYSLAFRLWQQEGKLLAYEEGKNAQHIQQIGIPGLKIGD